MSNPSPKLENLNPQKQIGDKPLARKSINIRMEQGYYERYMQLCPKTRGSLVRQVVQEAINQELKATVFSHKKIK